MSSRKLLVLLLVLIVTAVFLLSSCPPPVTPQLLLYAEDKLPPTLVILSPDDNSNYRSTIIVSGTLIDSSAEDGDGLGSLRTLSFSVSNAELLSIDVEFDNEGGYAVAAEEDTFAYDYEEGVFSFAFSAIGLGGPRVLTFHAADWNGNEIEKKITIFEDINGPFIQVTSPADQGNYKSGLSLSIEGRIANKAGDPALNEVASLQYKIGADDAVDITYDENGYFSTTYSTLGTSGTLGIKFVGEDIAGHLTELLVTLYDDETGAEIVFIEPVSGEILYYSTAVARPFIIQGTVAWDCQNLVYAAFPDQPERQDIIALSPPSGTDPRPFSFTFDTDNPGQLIGNYIFTVSSFDGQRNAENSFQVREDSVAPVIAPVSIESDNSNPAFAAPNDFVTLEFDVDDDLDSLPSVLIAGISAAVTQVDADTYTAARMMTSGDTEADIEYQVSIEDKALNPDSVTSTVAGTSTVTFTKSQPVLTVTIASNNQFPDGTPIPQTARTGSLISLDISSNQPLTGPPQVTIEGNSVTATPPGSGTDYTATYTMASGDSEPLVEFRVFNFENGAGIEGQEVNDQSLGVTNVSFDRTAPLAYNLTGISSSSGYSGAGWWNSTDSYIDCSIDVDILDPSLIGGAIQIEERVWTGSWGGWEAVGSASTISALGPQPAIRVNESAIEGHTDYPASSGGGYYMQFRAIVYDASANTNPVPPAGLQLQIDEVLPTVDSIDDGGLSEPTNLSPIPLTVTFSDAVTGFASGDITVGNGTAGTPTLGPTTWSVNITPTPLIEDTVTVDIDADGVIDAAGNPNVASSQWDIDFDGIQPTVDITSAVSGPTNQSPIEVTIEFSEDVSGFAIGDVIVGNGTAGNLSSAPTSSPWEWTVDITPTPSSDVIVTVNVNGSAAFDDAGNGNIAAPQWSIDFDDVRPTVAITSSETGAVTNADPIPMTITFLEDVTGFTSGDINVGNGSKSGFTPITANRVWTVNVAPSGQGEVTVDIDANEADDTAGNGNLAATQWSIIYDSVVTAATGVSYSNNSTGFASDGVNWVDAPDEEGSDQYIEYFIFVGMNGASRAEALTTFRGAPDTRAAIEALVGDAVSGRAKMVTATSGDDGGTGILFGAPGTVITHFALDAGGNILPVEAANLLAAGQAEFFVLTIDWADNIDIVRLGSTALVD